MNEFVLYLAASAILFLAFRIFRHKFNDPYGLFHLSLNVVESGSPPKTEWLNMGLWKETDVFPEACQALCMKTVRAAKLKEKGRVLDVGHGTGESLLFLLSESRIPRSSRVVGITSLPAHHQRSLARVQRLQAANSETQTTRVTLHQGDAVFRSEHKDHPLDPDSAMKFDSIVALDCAYHFDTRQKFLSQAFDKLECGGHIALADICFSSSSLTTFQTKWVTRLFRMIPSHNIISDDEYAAQMRRIGYTNVGVEDITIDVFPGFISFLKGRGGAWRLFAWMLGGYAGSGAKFVVVSGMKPYS